MAQRERHMHQWWWVSWKTCYFGGCSSFLSRALVQLVLTGSWSTFYISTVLQNPFTRETGILGVAVSMLGWVPGYSRPHPVPRLFPLHRLSHWLYLLISCSSGSTHTDRPLHGSLFNCRDHMDFLPPLDCTESFVICLCNILPCERVAYFCVIVPARDFSFSRWPSPTGEQRLPNCVPWAESSPWPICV